MAVGRKRHRRRVACLARHLNHGLSFCEEERDERVPQIVGTEVVQARRGRGRSEDPLAPVTPVFVIPGCAVEPREDERFIIRLVREPDELAELDRLLGIEYPRARLGRDGRGRCVSTSASPTSCQARRGHLSVHGPKRMARRVRRTRGASLLCNGTAHFSTRRSTLSAPIFSCRRYEENRAPPRLCLGAS